MSILFIKLLSNFSPVIYVPLPMFYVKGMTVKLVNANACRKSNRVAKGQKVFDNQRCRWVLITIFFLFIRYWCPLLTIFDHS